MFKEVLKIAFEDLGLKSLPIRGVVDPKNGIVEDMTISIINVTMNYNIWNLLELGLRLLGSLLEILYYLRVTTFK